MRCLSVLLLAGTPLAAWAQERVIVSCPAADSAHGKPKSKQASWFAKYDKLLDSTRYDAGGQGLGASGFTNNHLDMNYQVSSRGKNLMASDAAVLVRVKAEQPGEASRGRRGLLGNPLPLQFLLDNSLRFQLEPVDSGAVRDRDWSFGNPAHIEEIYFYHIGDDQILRLAQVSKGVVGIGRFRSGLKGSLRVASENVLRARLCASPQP